MLLLVLLFQQVIVIVALNVVVVHRHDIDDPGHKHYDEGHDHRYSDCGYNYIDSDNADDRLVADADNCEGRYTDHGKAKITSSYTSIGN